MKESSDYSELQKVLMDLMEEDSDFDNFDRLKIVQDFIKDKDDHSVTYYTNVAA